MNTFNDLRNLKRNWNDYGAEPLNPEFIDTAEELFALLSEEFEIFPLADGGVQLEYEKEKLYIELVVEDKISVFWQRNNSEGEDTFDTSDLLFIANFVTLITKK